MSRSLQQYTDIEKFKSYEKTNCIAFEMAIRNKCILSTIELIYEPLYNENFKSNQIWTKDFVDFCKISSSFELIKFFEKSGNNILNKKVKELHLDCYMTIDVAELLSLYTFSKYYNAKPLENNWFWIVIDSLFQINSIKILKENMPFHEEDFDGFYIESYTSQNIFKQVSFDEDLIDKMTDEECNIFLDSHEDYIRKEKFKNIKDGFHYVRDLFTRPKLNIPAKIETNVQCNLNLYLDETELLDYVRHIKQNYDNANLIKTPIELSGKALNKKKDSLFFPNHEKKYKNPLYKTSLENIANMFFIYDAHNNGISNKKICDEITYFRRNINTTAKEFSEKTLIKYLEYMNIYIEDSYYKELIAPSIIE